MHNKKTFEVQDISQAAYLLLRGHKIDRISREGPVVYWHFEDGDRIAVQDIRNFINGDGYGDCKKFSEALKTLKQTLRTN